MGRPLELTRDQVREVDRLAIDELGIPGVVLMENAGRGAAGLALELMLEAPVARAVVLCGGGNNGGDGWVVARHLSIAGVEVLTCALQRSEQALGDAAVMRGIVERMGLPVRFIGDEGGVSAARRDLEGKEVALVVDALLGTGFRGQLREDAVRAIEWAAVLRSAGARVLALDVPSGLDCDTGRPARPAIEADATATFVATKRGFASRSAAPYVGRVVVLSIGTPESLIPRAVAAFPA